MPFMCDTMCLNSRSYKSMCDNMCLKRRSHKSMRGYAFHVRLHLGVHVRLHLGAWHAFHLRFHLALHLCFHLSTSPHTGLYMQHTVVCILAADSCLSLRNTLQQRCS